MRGELEGVIFIPFPLIRSLLSSCSFRHPAISPTGRYNLSMRENGKDDFLVPHLFLLSFYSSLLINPRCRKDCERGKRGERWKDKSLGKRYRNFLHHFPFPSNALEEMDVTVGQDLSITSSLSIPFPSSRISYTVRRRKRKEWPIHHTPFPFWISFHLVCEVMDGMEGMEELRERGEWHIFLPLPLSPFSCLPFLSSLSSS